MTSKGAALLWVSSLAAACGSTGSKGAASGGNATAGSGGNANNGSKGATTITMWARDSQKTFIGDLTKAFNKSHTDVQLRVDLIPASNFVQKFGTAVGSGSGPDVVSIDLVYLPYFSSVGALEDITDRANTLSYKSGLDPAHMRLATYKGKLYALPFTSEASVLYYNKTLFKKAGLDPDKPPKTWADIETAARKIRELGDGYYGYVFSGACAGCNAFTFMPYIWASGGDVLKGRGDNPKPTFDSSIITEALSLYRRMWQQGVMAPLSRTDQGSNAGPAFASGKIGIYGSGAFFIPTLSKAKGFEWAVTPIPGKSGGYASFAGGDEIAIPKTSKNKDAAWSVIKWATGKDAQSVLAHDGIVPIRTDLLKSIYEPLNPNYPALARAMLRGRTPYSTVYNALFNDNNGPWITMIDDAVFKGNIEQAQRSAQQKALDIVSSGTSG